MPVKQQNGIGFGSGTDFYIEKEKQPQFKNKMSIEDQMIYEALDKAIEMGEKSKFPYPVTKFCKDCRAYNSATDASNEILQERKKEIEDKYNQ